MIVRDSECWLMVKQERVSTIIDYHALFDQGLKGLCHRDLAIFGPNYPEISDSQLNPFRTLPLNIKRKI